MTLPDTGILYLREDERRYDENERALGGPQNDYEYWCDLFRSRLIEARKNCERQLNELEAEIARLQIASGEVMPQSIGDEVV